MAKQEKASSPFFKPTKIGETVEGSFVHFEVTKPPIRKGETQKKGLAMKIQPKDDGQAILVPCGYSLLADLDPVRKTLKPGVKVKVRFDGTAKTARGGNPVKKMTVWIAGKEIAHQSPFGKPAENKELDEIFGTVKG